MTERSLKGKTLFITGGSRGIGRAIALRAALDGANVVIAAKTDTQHAKLEGTIHSVAAEVVKLGGQALACKVDLRNPDEVQSAIDACVARFGGIDILVNNASAIQISGTLHTDIKRFDLMNQVNSRGTFVASKLCLPHLLKSKNPHILTLSPPLDLNPKWFGPNLAYTMAKYGMSMTVLGLAEEFKDEGVAVNALWPVTVIATAAVNMLGGDALKNVSRTEEIMSDAAWYILTRESKKCTGNFFLDEDVLREEGITNFDKYSYIPGATLAFDLFVDPETRTIGKGPNKPAAMLRTSATHAIDSIDSKSSLEKHQGDYKSSFDQKMISLVPTSSVETASASSTVSAAISTPLSLLEDTASQNNRVRRISAVVQYDVKENTRTAAESFTLDLAQANAKLYQGKVNKKPDCVIGISLDDLLALVQGRLDIRDAFSSGRIIIRGNLKVAMQLHGACGVAKL